MMCSERTQAQRDSENLPLETSRLVALDQQNIQAKLPHARKLLYITHLFAQFSGVAWQFCLVLFLAAFTNYESLMLVSTYGLTSGLAICLLGSTMGQFIDNSNRLFAAQRFIWAENVFVLVATILSYMLLTRDLPESALFRVDDDDRTSNDRGGETTSWLISRLRGVPLDLVSLGLLIGIHMFGSAAEVLNRGFLVAIERDWIVVMSKVASRTYGLEREQQSASSVTSLLVDASEKAWLSETNVTMKQIDLSCKVGAPAIAGFIIAAMNKTDSLDDHGKDLRGAALLVGFLNFVALIVEYMCTAYIYQLIPDLALKEVRTFVPASDEEESTSLPAATNAAGSVGGLDYTQNCQQKECTSQITTGCQFFKLPRGLKIYMDQSVAWGGIGFAMLYLNALTFGAIMTAYLLWRGMLFSSIGVWRGLSSAIGLLGTVVYHYSAKKMSVELTGMWSICFQFVCLSLSYASLFVNDYMISLVMLISGVCASRIGLWVFDISMTQIFQECIPGPVRGVTGGVQQSLNAFFGLLAFALGIFFPNPREFHIYVSAGYASVGICTVIYTFSIYMRRDNLRNS